MTNKQLYNLVFENFVQAKRELIREGYSKKINEIDFNEVFDKAKHKLAEEKIKSLKRENEMLKGKLSKMKSLKEGIVDTQGGLGSGNSKLMNWLFDLIDKGLAARGNKDAILTVIVDGLIKKGKLSDGLEASTFARNLAPKLGRMPMTQAILVALRETGVRGGDETLSESKKRRRY
jgi:hypothetical protein